MRYLIVLLLLTGCATQHAVTLYPRAPGAQGTGTLSRYDNALVVDIEGRVYTGKWRLESSRPGGIYGPQSPNVCSALIFGEAGQLRCDFAFDQMWTHATGVCVDRNNIAYDMLVK